MLSASRQSGIDADTEKQQLRICADLIMECGVLLRLPQVVIASAQVLLHRFFLVASLRSHCHVWIAAACLLVASKAEEFPRRIRDIANVVYHRFCRRENLGLISQSGNLLPLDYYGQPGYKWKLAITSAERHLLKELGFHVFVEHTHKFILVFVNTLRDKSGCGDWTDTSCTVWRNLLQGSWNYASDIHRSQIVALTNPESIACACIAAAAHDYHLTLPEGWDRLFGGDVSSIALARDELRKLYLVSSSTMRFVDISESGLMELCGSRKIVSATADDVSIQSFK